MHKQAPHEWTVRVLPRSREVGQSYITSIWTTLMACFAAMMLVWQVAPDLVSSHLYVAARRDVAR